jgi:hypothetical protein
MRNNSYITARECEARDKSLHEKLDMILDNQHRYEEGHEKRHDDIDATLGQYKKDRNRVIGASAVVSLVIGFVLKFVR